MSAHIGNPVNKAHSTLGFLKHNPQRSSGKVKETTYISLVWSTLEYAATIWDHDLSKDSQAFEKFHPEMIDPHLRGVYNLWFNAKLNTL